MYLYLQKNICMDFQVKFKVNEKVYLRDPEGSELGKRIVKSAIDLIYELGFENFTFKKLATEIQTTEATVYRYFESKHRLLLYILNWYWSYMEFLVAFQVQNMKDPKQKIKAVVRLFTHELPHSKGSLEYNKENLTQIVINESSKVYLVKDVDEINKNEVFKPYKDLCAAIAEIILEYNPKYKYPKSLGTTLIETSHHQQFFSKYLPKLTDVQVKNKDEYSAIFIEDLVFKALS